MTPISITLENFLCYGTSPDGGPYVYDFRGSRLWSIAGDNGSGKSAIFDAITYCLFGIHRGGKSGDEELVHKGASGLRATFEFSHGGTDYRVTRRIRLGRRPRAGTPTVVRECQMEWLRPDGEWVEVPDTLTRSGLEDSVERLLGFGYETFTASVLLIQGESDRLVVAGGKERFDILSGILDLRRYERLAERARDRSRTCRDEERRLRAILEQAPPRTEQEVAAAASLADEAERESEEAQARKESALRLVDAVRAYHRLAERLAQLRAGQVEMKATLNDAELIRTEAAEYQDLVTTRPRLRQALTALAKGRIAEEEAESARRVAEAIDTESLRLRAEELSRAYTSAREAHILLVDEIARTRGEIDALAADLADARRLEELDTQIEQTATEAVELMKGADTGGELRARVDRLRQVDRARDLIAGYQQARESEAELVVWAAGADLESVHLQRKLEREAAEAAHRKGEDAFTVARREVEETSAELRSAERTVHERRLAGDEGTCSHCGQRVDAAHIQRELELAASRVNELSTALATRQEQMTSAAQLSDEQEKAVSQARAAEAEASKMLTTATEARRRIREIESDDRYVALPADVGALMRGPLDELLAGIERLWEEQRDLPGLEEQLRATVKARAQAEAKQQLVDRWEADRSQLLSRLSRERAADVAARDDQLRSQMNDLQGHEAKARRAEEEAKRGSDAAAKVLSDGDAARREAEMRAELGLAEARGYRQEASAALTGVAERFLPPTDAIASQVETRLEELADAESRLADLERAERGHAELEAQVKVVQGQVDVTPAAERVPEPEAVEAADGAATAAREARGQAGSLRAAADRMARSREDQLKLQGQANELGSQRAVWDLVAKLLGRGGIQTSLMKAALEDIQERANVMLSRISSANLGLEISFEQGRSGEEIHFRCVDAASSEHPLDVAFLSGGQRFRCAVALAAGIGEHAGLGGTMPSVIIDEGFGSLDAEGRTEMLEEVRAMSEHYERVIVVSHLESFQDRALFPSGYVLRKEGLQTLVTPTLWLESN